VEAVAALRQMGLRTVLLTGDAVGIATAVGRQLGVAEVEADGSRSLPVTAGRSGQLTRQAAQATEAGRCDRSAIWSHPILAGRVLAGRCRLRVPQPVPSPARKNAVAWSMAARVARVWLSALSSMKSWMMPS